eukprot:56203-Pyramimonas_sp.AAC.1
MGPQGRQPARSTLGPHPFGPQEEHNAALRRIPAGVGSSGIRRLQDGKGPPAPSGMAKGH